MKQHRANAFTLIELLVVVAIIALLISILLPSLQSAREAGRKAKCLANMKQIATGMHTYANDDSKTHAFPVQPVYGDPNTIASLSAPEFLYVTWWTWGGRDGVVPWVIAGNQSRYVREFNTAVPAQPESNPPNWRLYAAHHRPLNRTLYPNGINPTGQDRFDLPLFSCPSDIGYPLDSPTVGERIDDAPQAMRRIPLYDGLGNSYRASFACAGAPAGRQKLTAGPAGHRLDSIPSAGDTLWFADSLFFNMIGTNGAIPATSNTTLNFMGWHKRRAADNVAFVDGSARYTDVGSRVQFDPQTLQAMEVSQEMSNFLTRGPNWRLDVYPTGGALLMHPGQAGTRWISGLGNPSMWPVRGFQNNFN